MVRVGMEGRNGKGVKRFKGGSGQRGGGGSGVQNITVIK